MNQRTSAQPAIGFGWLLGTLGDGSDLYFDPAEWFASGLLSAPSASIEPLDEFPELAELPPYRVGLPKCAVSERTIRADPRVARAAIRHQAGRTFELVIGPNEEPQAPIVFERPLNHRLGYRPQPPLG